MKPDSTTDPIIVHQQCVYCGVAPWCWAKLLNTVLNTHSELQRIIHDHIVPIPGPRALKAYDELLKLKAALWEQMKEATSAKTWIHPPEGGAS